MAGRKSARRVPKKRVAAKRKKDYTNALAAQPLYGLFWHVHHGNLYDFCFNLAERTNYIYKNKGLDEIKIRLRRIRAVQKPVGDQVLYRTALETCRITNLAVEMVRAMKNKRLIASYISAKEICKYLIRLRVNSVDDYMDSVRSYFDMKRLHSKECKKCPWENDNLFHNAKSKELRNKYRHKL